MNTPAFHHLHGRKGLILGLANEHSIAYGCVREAQRQGAQVVATCLNGKARPHVEPLTAPLDVPLLQCDVQQEGDLEQTVQDAAKLLGQLDFVIHSIAWAPLAELHAPVVDSSSQGFSQAMDVSCHSFARLANLCQPHMTEGGSLVTMSYLGADEAVPNYG